MFGRGPLALAEYREPRAVNEEVQPGVPRPVAKGDLEVLTAAGERRVIGRGQAEAHQLEQRREEAFGLAERQVEEKTQRHGRFDGDVRVLPLPTPPAVAVRCPRRDRVGGQPHSEVAAPDEGVFIGGPVANVILCLGRGMDPRLHTEIVCCRPYMRRVDQRVFLGRAE